MSNDPSSREQAGQVERLHRQVQQLQEQLEQERHDHCGALASLRDSEHRIDQWMQRILEHSTDGINVAEFDPKTKARRLVLCNDRYVEMSGRSLRELLDVPDLNALSPPLYSRPMEGKEQFDCIVQGRPFCGRASWARPDGQSNIFEYSASPVRVGDKFYIVGVDRDVTKQEQAGEALRQSQLTTRALLNASHDRAFLITPEGRMLAANETGAEVLGLTCEEAVGRVCYDFFTPDVGARRRAAIEEACRTGLPTPDLSWRDGRLIDSTVYPIRDVDGEVRSLAVFGRDITEQHEALQALRSSERRFRELFEKAPLVILEADQSKTPPVVLRANARACEVYGYTEEEFRNLPMPELVAGDQVSKIGEVAAALAQQKAVSVMSRNRRKDGSVFIIRLFATPVPQSDPPRAILMVEDITELEQAQAALREAGQRLQGVIDNSLDTIFEVDLNGNLTLVNEAAVRQSGAAREQLLGANIAQFLGHEAQGQVFGLLRKMREGQWLEQPFRVDARSPAGEPLPLELTVSGVYHDGNLTAIQGIARDITEHLRQEQALRDGEKAERELRQRLTALHEILAELTMEETFDSLCLRTVELGRQGLGFDRLSLWFVSLDTGEFHGSFGTDECGRTRDERDRGGTLAQDPTWLQATMEAFRHERDVPLLNNEGEEVGRGEHVYVSMAAGQQRIGCITADNLLHHRPFTAGDELVLMLYATAVGHLCYRKRAEQALRESEQAERQLRERLRVLQETTIGLSQANGFDDFCRQAVEAGRDSLGFDRVGLWFMMPDGHRIQGSFGTDESGRTRDERQCAFAPPEGSPTADILRTRARFLARENCLRPTQDVQETKFADVLTAALWDGREVIGFLTADNLLHRRPFTHADRLVLQLYASALGPFCTRLRTLEALRDSERKLQGLATRLMNAREDERRRLARDLHDSLGQRTIALGYALKAAAGEVGDIPSLATAQRHCNDLVKEIRAICHGLYPPTLEAMGLAAALRQMATDCRQADIRTRVTIAKGLAQRRFEPEVEIALYRIGQEAIHNALKHGQAKALSLSLSLAGTTLRMTLQDDGQGFDATAQDHTGMGLKTMKERARAIGGTLEITSRPGRTKIVVCVQA